MNERRSFADSLERVGPDAPTLIPRWTAHDLAAHVVSLDRFGGVPTFVGRRIVTAGVRLNDTAGRFADRGLRPVKRRGFPWVLGRLRQDPPRLLLRPEAAVVGLFEVFVHHEDVRRANRTRLGAPREAPEALADVVPWLLRYHRRRLQGIELTVSTPAHTWTNDGFGPRAALRGSAGEVVLWLAGRREASDVEVVGEAAAELEAAALHI